MGAIAGIAIALYVREYSGVVLFFACLELGVSLCSIVVMSNCISTGALESPSLLPCSIITIPLNMDYVICLEGYCSVLLLHYEALIVFHHSHNNNSIVHNHRTNNNHAVLIQPYPKSIQISPDIASENEKKILVSHFNVDPTSEKDVHHYSERGAVRMGEPGQNA